MTIGDAYTRWATTYDTDRNRTRDLDRMTTEVLLGDNYYDKVLEIGCGTGKNTGFLVRVSRALLAIDFSVGMLEQAKDKVRSKTVLFVVADLTKSWPCQRNAFECQRTRFVRDAIGRAGLHVEVAFRSETQRGGNGIHRLTYESFLLSG